MNLPVTSKVPLSALSTVKANRSVLSVLLGIPAVIMGGWLAMQQFSPAVLGWGMTTLAAMAALFELVLRKRDLPDSRQLPWLVITALVLPILPVATLEALLTLSFDWLTVGLLAAVIVSQLARQLLRFRHPASSVAWLLVCAAPLAALMFGQALGHQAELTTEPLAVVGLILASLGFRELLSLLCGR